MRWQCKMSPSVQHQIYEFVQVDRSEYKLSSHTINCQDTISPILKTYFFLQIIFQVCRQTRTLLHIFAHVREIQIKYESF